MHDVRQSATLLVPHDQQHEGNEIEHEPAAPPDHERRGEQHQQIAIGRQRQPEREHLRAQRDANATTAGTAVARSMSARGGPQRWPPSSPASSPSRWVPFVHAPLTADEGGYGDVARLCDSGARLYDQAWVDRPQGLLLVFRAILHIDGR